MTTDDLASKCLNLVNEMLLEQKDLLHQAENRETYQITRSKINMLQTLLNKMEYLVKTGRQHYLYGSYAKKDNYKQYPVRGLLQYVEGGSVCEFLLVYDRKLLTTELEMYQIAFIRKIDDWCEHYKPSLAEKVAALAKVKH